MKHLIDRREMLTIASTLGASSALTSALPWNHASAAQPRRGGTLRVQMEVRPLKDPRLYDWSEIANLSRGWLEYLVRYRRDGVLIPQLLSSWEISQDARTYILNIRKGVTWNNGQEFTALDVAHNLERWCDRSVQGNSMAGRVGTLADSLKDKSVSSVIEIVDKHQIRLNLDRPDIQLIAAMADYPAAIVHSTFDPKKPEKSIGTGPYKLVEHKNGVRAVLERNRDHRWWNEGNGAYVDRIEFIDYGVERTAILSAINSNEVDMVYETPPAEVRINRPKDWRISEVITASTLVARTNARTNVNGSPPYADRRVRQALAMACDNAVITELGIEGLGFPAENHHVCPLHPEYAPLPPLKTDPFEAAKLLRSANMQNFEHELTVIDDDWRQATAKAIAQELSSANIPVKLKVLPGSQFWNDWAKYPFSCTNWNMRPLGVQIYALAYRSGEAWNESGFSNPEFDKLLEKALGVADLKERQSLMKQMQFILQQEAPIIQPYWRNLYRHFHKKVRNAAMHPMNELHVDEIWLAA